jgi:hypothetical protein
MAGSLNTGALKGHTFKLKHQDIQNNKNGESNTNVF